jgi:hypothetical protein
MGYTKEQLELSVRVIMMYYHTSFRNIGLYTSLSLATLGASRFHRGKSYILNVSLIAVSILFNILAILVGRYMLNDIDYMKNKQEEVTPLTLVDKWTMLPKVTIAINIGIILSSFVVLYEQVTKK